MNHVLTGNTHLLEPTLGTMFTGNVQITLNEDDPSAPFAELKIRSESGEPKVFRYTDPAQIDVLWNLLSTIETTHTQVEIPVAVG